MFMFFYFLNLAQGKLQYELRHRGNSVGLDKIVGDCRKNDIRVGVLSASFDVGHALAIYVDDSDVIIVDDGALAGLHDWESWNGTNINSFYALRLANKDKDWWRRSRPPLGS